MTIPIRGNIVGTINKVVRTSRQMLLEIGPRADTGGTCRKGGDAG
jgi:hypothetical protein